MKAKRYFKMFLAGFGNALVIFPRYEYKIPRNGFAEDAKNLRGDCMRINKDVGKTIKKYPHAQIDSW